MNIFLKLHLRDEDSSEMAIASNEDGNESVDALAVLSLENENSMVLDLRCSYHKGPKKEYFETLKYEKCKWFLLGDDKTFKVHSIVMVKLKMFDDWWLFRKCTDNIIVIKYQIVQYEENIKGMVSDFK